MKVQTGDIFLIYSTKITILQFQLNQINKKISENVDTTVTLKYGQGH